MGAPSTPVIREIPDADVDAATATSPGPMEAPACVLI
ncbi:MAG: hypothetical protein QOF40_3544, partial [Actinomycetota bacterium]|nr:hypothetical protein [Actinomycetota bacterium]